MKDSLATSTVVARLLTAVLLFAMLAAGNSVAASQCPAAHGANYAGKDLSNTNFAGAAPGALVGANFTGAILKGATFANQNLQGASFERAVFGAGDGGSQADFSGASLDKTCFAGATGLGGADLTYAVFRCADFSNTVLVDAVFGPSQDFRADPQCRTSFAGATLRVDAISLDNWGRADFSGAHLHGLAPASFTLAGKDISGARLAGIDFSSIDMRGANLTQVDFSSATLAHADLRYTTLNGATLVKAQAPYVRLDCARFYGAGPAVAGCDPAPPSSAPGAHADLTSANLQHASLGRAIVDAATLSGANLSGASARNASFRNAWLEADPQRATSAALVKGADLSGAAFQGAHINAVQFNRTTLAGAQFDGSTLNGTNFSGAIMPGASFGGRAVLEGVDFSGAELENAVFTDATIRNNPRGGVPVDFSCAQLGGASFQDASVTGANFQAAVMPPAAACCPQPGGGAWCGTVDFPAQAYGGVRYPALKAALTCPNGENAVCDASQWTLPGWQTDLCSPSPSEEPVWTKPDCAKPSGEVVRFNDANLKKCIREMLPGAPQEVEVSVAMTFLDVSCRQRGIADLTGLEKFVGLLSLDLSGNKLVQFRQPTLSNLQKLDLSANGLKTLDLSGLGPLLSLDASHNQLQAIVSWATLETVELLDLSYNQLTQTPLAALSQLVMADVSHNATTDVLGKYRQNLKGLKVLRYLNLSHNGLTGIGDVSGFIDVNQLTLQLQCNPRFDCGSLGIADDQDALENNACARYNSQTEKWLLQPYPSCPGQPPGL